MDWRWVSGSVVALLCVACTAEGAEVHSMNAARIAGAPVGSSPPVADETSAAPTASLFATRPLAMLPDDRTLLVPHSQQEPEAAIHALASAPDGWLAVGSNTSSGQHGAATVWTVAADGSFGSATTLPTPDDAPSVARGAVTDAFGTVVVGASGTGRQSLPTAWVKQPGSDWSMVDLPIDPAMLHGAIADRVLRLTDGTTVVVGRGNGPFFSDLILWASIDNGATWVSTSAGKSYLEPLVATDGTRVALLVRTDSDPITNFAGHTALVFGMQINALTQLDLAMVDLTPGRRFWPNAFAWDGTQFVVGLQIDIGPAIATSSDGINYSVTEFRPPELEATAAASVVALAMIDGSLVIAVEQLSTLYVFRRDGENFTAIPIPYQPSGSLGYLDFRRLSASDGHRFTYVAGDWDGFTQLSWDGQAWASLPMQGLAKWRNAARLEVSTIASAAGSDLALVTESYTEAPGKFENRPAGMLWRPAGADEWQEFAGPLADLTTPVWVTAWHDIFIVVGHEFALNRSTIYRFDPTTGEATALASLDGFVGRLVTDTGHLYARVSGVAGEALGNSTLWESADGVAWSEVDLGFAPRTMCSNGDVAVVEWMTSNGEASSTMGLSRVNGVFVSDRGSILEGAAPFQFQPFQVVAEPDQVMRCGVNNLGVVTTLLGFDRAIADPSPQSRVTTWIPGITSTSNLVLPVSRDAAWKSKITDITWNGREWIAVGTGIDVESASDALMWKSADGLFWEPAITLAGGPGNQIANSVTVRDGEMLIGGCDGQQAMIWRLPA